MSNRLGVISMFYSRPFTTADFACFERIKAAGLDFIELLVPEPGELDLAAMRRALADADLGVLLAARINPTRDAASADPNSRQGFSDYLAYAAEVAATLAAPVVGGPLAGGPLVFAGRAPAPVGEPERVAREGRVVEALSAAATIAKAHGITFALEPLNRFETDILNTTRQCLEVVRRVASPHLGLMLDTFHMAIEEKSMGAAIRAAGPHLVHFQANENDRGFVGTGSIDWSAVVEALRSVDYRGPITLEPFRRDDERIAVPLAQWRPPNRNEDADLAQSARYLRDLLERRK
jgi:D-psicose/D-tagatose/L-ribulose 3-epimerase